MPVADIPHALDLDGVAIFLACNPFILLGLAWLAMRSPGRCAISEDVLPNYQEPDSRIPLLSAKTRGKSR
jgi:hypothetical protein